MACFLLNNKVCYVHGELFDNTTGQIFTIHFLKFSHLSSTSNRYKCHHQGCLDNLISQMEYVEIKAGVAHFHYHSNTFIDEYWK